MRLYLIRHGETGHNFNRVMQGHGEVPLNDTGIQQAVRLAQRLTSMPLDRIYSSDLRRAVMTATVIAAYTGVPIEYDSGFRERDPGQLTGLSYDVTEPFFTDRGYQPPGGENVPVFEDRIRRAFAELTQREFGRERHVAVVTHGMVCAGFLRACAGFSDADIEGRAWPNTSLTVADFDGAGWTMHTIADAAHLDDPVSTVHATGG